MVYSCRLPAFNQGRLRTVPVSELPGYPGRWHAQRSHYVTAKFPRKEMSTIDQNFTYCLGTPRSRTTNGYKIVPRPMCAPTCTTHFLPQQIWKFLCTHTIPTYFPTIWDNQLLVWLTAHFQTEKEKRVVRSYLLWMARTQWTQYVILTQLPNVIPAMRQLWLSRSVKKGCCYAEGEDITSHPI